MKILWHSTAPWGGSSYSILTKRTVPELLKLGHEVVISTWYGLQGAPQHVTWQEDGQSWRALVLPSIHPQSYGQDVLLPACKMFKPDAVITCMDIWVLPPELTRQLPFFAPWLPIDHDPAPEMVVGCTQAAGYPMVYSQWGTDILKAAGIDAHYVPCSAPSNIYHPMDKAECKKKLGVPDGKFLVGMVAANKDQADRKGFSSGLQGFAKFAEKHDDADLYIHSDWGGIIEIPAMCDSLGLRGKVIQPDPIATKFGMYTDQNMATIYNAFDVLLNPALSEGFGLPMLEAQMCGVPIVGNEFSTTKELLFAGWTVGGMRIWSFGAKSWRIMCDPEQIGAALGQAYDELSNPKRAEALSKKARAGATALDDKIVGKAYWKPALEAIEKLACGGGKLELVTF